MDISHLCCRSLIRAIEAFNVAERARIVPPAPLYTGPQCRTGKTNHPCMNIPGYIRKTNTLECSF